MRMRRYHEIEITRYYQRLENIENRKKENERQRQTNVNFILRGFRRLGFFRRNDNELLR